MLHEYRDIVSKLKVEDKHFARIFDRHNELDNLIKEASDGVKIVEDVELEKLKKEKLSLKDEAYNMVLKYKKDNNL